MNNSLNAGNPSHGERRNAMVDMHHDINRRMQAATIGDNDPWLMCRRHPFSAVDADRAEWNDLQHSMNHRMAGMRIAFISSGGLRSVGELTLSKDQHSRTRFAQIARWIATREVIGFMWQGEPWVPMFQFEPGPQLRPRQSLQPLFGLLVPLYDAWDMAHWFARPNDWLSGRRPVDFCANRLSAVLDVAHLEHFIASGMIQPQDRAAGHRNVVSTAT